MVNEITVPLLPCGSIDEIVEFYTMLGFTRIYYQTRPNPYVSVKREDLQLGFFGMPEFTAEDSYGTCLVVVDDPQELFDAFAAGMRNVHGRLLVAGIPRMTRPRKRKNADNHSGFTVIDPGGNWIRIVARKRAPDDEGTVPGRLTSSLNSAVVLGDSHDKPSRAAQILDTALERDKDTASAVELVEALAYRAELAVRADDIAAAADAIAWARSVPLTEVQRRTLAGALVALDDLDSALGPTQH